MDNITHSVIGLGVGELLHRSLPPEPHPPAQRTRRALFLFTAWFASNAPDLDLVLTRLLPRIRYQAVAKAIDKGMRFVGLSDFTAFLSEHL